MLYDTHEGAEALDGLAGLREKARRVACLLERAYGVPERRSRGDALDQLVMTVLSQNTSDRNSWRAYTALRSAFPTWDAVLAAPEDEVVGAIQCGGLARIKAGRIREILRQIRRQRSCLDLSFLQELPTDAVRAYLTGFAGVGPKTAACVLLFALERPVLPVDTHVFRVARRLGLIGPSMSVEDAHEALQALVREDQVYAFHVNMITHGRCVCLSRTPSCGCCPLAAECPSSRVSREE